MAINSRQARREAERERCRRVNDYKARFIALYHNSVTVKNAKDLPKRYLLGRLLKGGAIAYDKITGLYLPFNGVGVDAYGLPTSYVLVSMNGFTYTRKPEEVVILRANDLQYGLLNFLEIQAERIVDIDTSISQNIDAIRTQTIAEVPDEATLLSVANEVESRRIGATVLYRNKSAMQGVNLKVDSTGATYLVDKLQEAKQHEIDETLATLGTMSSNTQKRERVQQAEVDASNGYAKDFISVLIDTFNYDAEYGGIPIRLELNTSLGDIENEQCSNNDTECDKQ